jgi:hypothetical protein
MRREIFGWIWRQVEIGLTSKAPARLRRHAKTITPLDLLQGAAANHFLNAVSQRINIKGFS